MPPYIPPIPGQLGSSVPSGGMVPFQTWLEQQRLKNGYAPAAQELELRLEEERRARAAKATAVPSFEPTPEDLAQFTGANPTAPLGSPAGPAASIDPPPLPPTPPGPVRIVRGPNGEIMGTNLADDRKTLALGGDFRNNTPDANSLRAEVAKSGPMHFSSDTGHTATLTPGGIGGYTYGGDIPSMNLSAAQVEDDKNLNPGQKAGWMDRKNEEFEMAMKAAAVEKLKAEASNLTAQGGLFGAQGGLFGEQQKGLEQRRTMTPEESAYRGSTVPLEQWVMQNEDKIAVTLTPMVESAYLGLLANPNNMKLAKDPAFRLQLRQQAKAAAIKQYVQEHQEQLMKALMGSGSYMPSPIG